MPDVSTELILKIQEAVINGRKDAITGDSIYDLDYDVASILERAGYPVSVIIEEEKPVRPADSIMWEIEVPVIYHRTYHVPAINKEEALEFFLTGGAKIDDMFELFAEQEDNIDGEDTFQAVVIGPSPSWVNYIPATVLEENE